MVDNIFVSICIPTFNGERYLKECLDSCVNQTYGNFEIVICDDGSSDNTITIIKDYMNMYPNIFLFENKNNLGMVENWNNCIKRSRGEWIKFVFQDDFIRNDCLSKFVLSARPDAQLVVSKRDFIVEDKSDPIHVKYYESEIRTLENVTSFKGSFYSPKLISSLAAENICMNFIGEPSLIFFRKRTVKELGEFTNTLKQICDLEFVLRIASKYGLYYLPEKLCAFRVHSNSTTTSNVQNNEFEMSYVETSVFTWYLLFGEKFSDFRACITLLQRLKLLLYFKTKVYLGNLTNTNEAKNHELFSSDKSAFKEISENKKGGLFIRLVAGYTVRKVK